MCTTTSTTQTTASSLIPHVHFLPSDCQNRRMACWWGLLRGEDGTGAGPRCLRGRDVAGGPGPLPRFSPSPPFPSLSSPLPSWPRCTCSLPPCCSHTGHSFKAMTCLGCDLTDLSGRWCRVSRRRRGGGSACVVARRGAAAAAAVAARGSVITPVM